MSLRTQIAIVPLLASGVEPITAEELEVAYVDARNWRLLEAFDFASETLERIIHVPAGFETDFASTPRILWDILPPSGLYTKAAVIHDYLYRTPGVCTRADADKTFLEAMTALGVSRVVREGMYAGVRMGGASSYQGGL